MKQPRRLLNIAMPYARQVLTDASLRNVSADVVHAGVSVEVISGSAAVGSDVRLRSVAKRAGLPYNLNLASA